jgi:microcin C transport system substrate-binding protein
MHRLAPWICWIAAATVALTGCDRAPDASGAGRENALAEFIPLYNAHVQHWIVGQQAAVKASLAEVDAALATATPEARQALEAERAALLREEQKWAFRTGLGDFLGYADPATIPADLVWEDGMQEPEIGDPRALKGGVFRNIPMVSFPPTMRSFGPNSNHGYRSQFYDEINISMVGLHPATGKIIPGLAKRWAVSSDGRTVYYEIDPDATYSDGVPVKAEDFLTYIYIRVSDYVSAPFEKEYIRDQFAKFTVLGDHHLAVTLPEAKPLLPYFASASPAPPHFYREYGPDFAERYQWRFPPTTGAYVVRDEDIVKGVSITQTRVEDWWARDKKFYRYRFNVNKIVSRVVRDEAKGFELFRAAEIDAAHLTRPENWHEKSEIPPVFDGYIERHMFYTRYPRIPYGLYLNIANGLLSDRNVRLGISHAMNFRRVIDLIHRGDYARLSQFSAGYGEFTDPNITARPYSVQQAREYFALAGFTDQGPDGILRRPDGTRLTVSLTYNAQPIFDRIMAILQEEGRKAGIDLRLDNLESTVSYRKVMQKQHEMTFTAWGVGPPFPDYHQFLHSSNARDERGNLKPQTNNIFSYANPEMDALVERVRNARDTAEIKDASWKVQKLMDDEAIFVPGFSMDFVRVGSWRWVRWPDSDTTRFCPPIISDPFEVHVHWIDPQIEKDTRAAMRSGQTFPEVIAIHDDYREGQPSPESNE